MQFKDIIGQEELKGHLARSIDRGRVSHAQLFTGCGGCGTLALALAYVQYLNCKHRQNGDSCGVCPDCQRIARLEHPDLHLVFPVNKQGKKSGEAVLSDDFVGPFRELVARTGGYVTAQEWYERLDLGKTLSAMITTKEADEVIRKLSFKAFEAEYKTMLIWLPETMNEEAANKLLKILEEPWDKTLFLWVSEHPDRLLQTILSRTQQVDVPRISVEALERAALERGAEPQKARTLARQAGGDYCELRRLLEGRTDEGRRENFDLFCRLMRLSYNDKHLELMAWADEVAALTRERQRAFLTDAARLLRESYMIHAGLSGISCLWGEEADFCRKFSPFIGNANIEPLIAQIEQAMTELGFNANAAILFTHFALRVSQMINRLQ